MYLFKRIVIFGILGAIFYFLLAYHYIIIDDSVKMLKKSNFTLKYTVFSTKGKTIESILSVRDLWNDGIGDLLLKEGKISAERLEMYRERMKESNY